MLLTHLETTNFRNLISCNLNFNKTNLFFGDNGSGKSSLLEAIYYLAHGKSFRTHLISRIIQYQKDSFALHGKIYNSLNDLSFPIGIERFHDGQTKIRIANENTSALASLAKLLPLQLLNQNCFNLLTGGPKFKRKFMDWGLFHVEQSFFACWKEASRLLLQINCLLKQNASPQKMLVWYQALAEKSLNLHQYRQKYISQLLPIVNSIIPKHFENIEISIDYYAGWDVNKDLLDIMQSKINQDLKAGSMLTGAHRADLKFVTNNFPAQDVLSRGQQKLLVFILQLSQGLLLKQQTTKNCLFLVDDISSELDDEKQQILLNYLISSKFQVFLTSLSKNSFCSNLISQGSDLNMFHVKQGEINISY